MRRTPYLLLVAMAMILSASICSCSEDPEEKEKKEQEQDKSVEDWENEDINGDATMSSRVIQFSVDSIPSVTRGVTPFDGKSYSFSVGDRITIEMYRGSTKVGTKVYKVKNASGLLEFDDTGLPFAWENKSETVKLRAWSYGTSTAFTTEPKDNSFTLNTDQKLVDSKENYKELLYSPQQEYDYSANVALSLYHQMARLTVTLTNTKATALSVTANSVIIGDGTLPVSAYFSEDGIDINNSDFIGSWTDPVAGDGTTGKVIARTDVANSKYSAVLFPGTITSGKKLITLTTTDGTFAYTLPSNITLQPGCQYNYSITVKDGVGFNDVTATHHGWYVNTDGTVTETKNERGKSSVARIAYVRKANDPSGLDSYFSKFIAIALEDISTSPGSWTRIVVDADTWASNASNRIVYEGTTYSGCSNGTSPYDNSNYFTGGTSWMVYTGNIKRGWRVPTITDWNYLFDGICGKTVVYGTTAANFNVGYVTPSTTLPAINNFCQGSDGTTSPSFMRYFVYTAGTEPDSTNGWVINLTNDNQGNWGWNYKRDYDSNDSRLGRLVFAY